MTTEHRATTDDNDLNWVYKHLDELKPFEGKWIAVLHQEVLTSADDADGVVEFLDSKGINGALLFEMPEDVHREVYLVG